MSTQFVNIGNLVTIDCTVSQKFSAQVQLTEHPVEVGADVTDHARVKAETLQLEGIISATGMSLSDQQLRGGGAPGDLGFAKTQLDTLVAIKNSRQALTVTTEARTYENMVMTALDVPRDAKTGDAIKFSIQFTEVRFAKLELVRLQAIKPANPATAVKKDNQGKKTPEPEEAPSSWLIDASDAAGLTNKLGFAP